MGRWTQEDEDEYRLPEGMQRTGYDADTGRYYFQDREGNVWEGAEGAEFSEMRLVSEGGSRREGDIEAARAEGYQPLAVGADTAAHHVSFQSPRKSSLSAAYQSLFPFILLIAVILLLAWRLLLAPALFPSPPFSSSGSPSSKCPGPAQVEYWVRPGDSCWAIGKKVGLGVEGVKEMNPGLECGKLMPGTIVCLPVGSNTGGDGGSEKRKRVARR